MTKNIDNIKWTRLLSYAVGLVVTDGSLSTDGRHIDISSVDREQLENLSLCLGKKYSIGVKKSGTGNICFRIQFSDVKLYTQLLNIGITPHKSKSIGKIDIPKEYFFDFLRGHFDGDGTIYSYHDPRWRNSYMFYFCFNSASQDHILWLRSIVNNILGLKGSISKAKTNSVYQLRYAKKESLVLIEKLYYNKQVICLSRKRLKIKKILENDKISASAVMVARLA